MGEKRRPPQRKRLLICGRHHSPGVSSNIPQQCYAWKPALPMSVLGRKKTKEAATETPIYSILQVWEDVKRKGMKNLTTALLLTHCRSEFNSTHGKWTLPFIQEYPRES